MNKRCEKFILFDHSANQDMVAAIERAQPVNPGVATTVGQMLATGEMWIARAEGIRWVPSAARPYSIEQMKNAFKTQRDMLLSLCDQHGDGELIPYEDLSGYITSERFDDIVQEILLRSARYRGQIDVLLRYREPAPATVAGFFRILKRGLAKTSLASGS